MPRAGAPGSQPEFAAVIPLRLATVARKIDRGNRRSNLGREFEHRLVVVVHHPERSLAPVCLPEKIDTGAERCTTDVAPSVFDRNEQSRQIPRAWGCSGVPDHSDHVALVVLGEQEGRPAIRSVPKPVPRIPDCPGFHLGDPTGCSGRALQLLQPVHVCGPCGPQRERHPTVERRTRRRLLPAPRIWETRWGSITPCDERGVLASRKASSAAVSRRASACSATSRRSDTNLRRRVGSHPVAKASSPTSLAEGDLSSRVTA